MHNSSVDFYDAEINDILIIGESNTSFSFSQSLQTLDYFTRIFHVIKAEDAIKLLVQEDFSVILIDNDADDVDPINISKLIRDNLPLSRIVILSADYSISMIKELINFGSIDAFIPVPIDPFSGSSIIVEQYAKYQINQTLFNLVSTSPPKFSQSYYLLHDPSLQSEKEDEIKFVGFVIIYSSVTKFAKFFSDLINIDEYLLTGYLSAISLLGQQLFTEHSFFKEINFGGLSVVMHQENDLQYLFFYKDLNKISFMNIEGEMDQIVERINTKFSSQLNSQFPLGNELDEEIISLITGFQEKYQNILDMERKQNLVLYGNQLPKLNEILSKKTDKYHIWRFFTADDVLNHLISNPTDILVMNQKLEDDNWNFTLASQAKDIHPSLQIIALLERLNQQDLLKILNDEYLDFVLSYKAPASEIEANLDLAFDEALKIQNYLTNYHPHNIQYSLHRSVIARSMLRNYTSTFQVSNIPEFFGVFIMQGDLPYFTKLWPANNGEVISFDEQLFAGFISSMEMFTDEMFDRQEEFSGFRFGDITILIKHELEFVFVFFLSNIDHTNFLMIDKQLDYYSDLIYESIVNSDGFFDLNPENQYDITSLIEQQLNELFMRLVALNFSKH